MFAALTIAGSDSGGGAGIQADLKTFEAFDVFGTSVITAITAQNSLNVDSVWPVPNEMISKQMKSVLSDFKISAIKTGMLFSSSIIETIVDELSHYSHIPLVVDPVMVATSGDKLFEQEAIETLCKKLLPIATLITPNRYEAEILSGMVITTFEAMETAAQLIVSKWNLKGSVLVKGGHLPDGNAGEPKVIRDFLFTNGKYIWIEGPFIKTTSTHGTGCTLSAAIAAGLARGFDLEKSVRKAKEFVTNALENGWKGLSGGKGSLKHNFLSGKIAE